jgi:inositol-hexakisphosphate kinase
MGPAIDTDHRRKHRYPLSPPSSGSATAQSSPKLSISTSFHFDESEIVHGLSSNPFQGSDSRIVASCNKIDGNTLLSEQTPHNKTSFLQPTRNLTSMYPPTRQPLSDQPLPVPKTIRPLSRGSSESSSSSSTPFTRDQISPPPSGRKVADSLQLFKETEDPKPSDTRPDSYKLHRPVSSSKTDGVAEAQFEFVKRSEWPDRESAAVRRDRSTTTLERMWTRDSNGSPDADIWGGKERKTVRDNVLPQRRRDLLALQDVRGRRRERASEEGVFDFLSGPESPISPRDPHDRAPPLSTFGYPRSRVYPPSPSPSRSPKCRVPPLNLSKPSTRSPSLPSENPALQDTIAISVAASHAKPLQSLPVRHSSPGPPASALDSYSPWSTDDESNWESASVATSTSTTSTASDFPPHASPRTPFLHSGSDRGDGEPVVASNSATMLSEPLDGADEADSLDLDEFPPSSLPPIPLTPFPNQVGGHKAIYKFTKRAVCKVRAFLVIDISADPQYFLVAPGVAREPLLRICGKGSTPTARFYPSISWRHVGHISSRPERAITPTRSSR